MEFDNLLKQACSIKSYQLNQDKKKFENSPEFIKATLYCSDMVKNVRKQIFPLRKIAFETFRITGVKLISNGLIEDALFKFEKALTIFKYINSSVINWKNEAIKDEDLSYHEDKGENDQERLEISKLIISALLNISLCYLKTNKYNNLKLVCNEILERDNKNIKAYYRRAKSVLNCPSSSKLSYKIGLEDYEIALLDLEKSLEYEEESNKKDLKEEYDKLKNYIYEQKIDEKKVFKNFFRKTNESLLREEIKPTIKSELPNGKAEIRMINLLIDQSISLMNSYEKERKSKEYWKMQEVVEQSKKYKENLEKILELNFDKPNEELSNFCQKNNLKLDDPNVKTEFLKIRQEYLDKINNFYAQNLFMNPNLKESVRNQSKKKKIKNDEKEKNEIKSPLNTKENSKTIKDEYSECKDKSVKLKSKSVKTNFMRQIIMISIIIIIISIGLVLVFKYLPPIKFKF